MTAITRLGRTSASPGTRHPLDTREKRTVVNYALRAKGIPSKACSLCWVVKSTGQFSGRKSASDGLEPDCRPCHNARYANRIQTDAEFQERHRAYARESARRLYPSKRTLISKQAKKRRSGYVMQNASRVKDPGVLRRCAGQCGQLLPETEFRLDRNMRDGLRARCRYCSGAERRARKACLEAYGDPLGWTCYLCGHEISIKSEAWVDHVIPQSKGGHDTADNLRWTHGLCNLSRSNSPLTPEQVQRFEATASTLSGEDQ